MPALTIFLGLGQVEGESTSLLMIVIVALVGAYRQNGYGNVRLREALVIGVLSPLGVLIGVGVSNEVPTARWNWPSPPWPSSWPTPSSAAPSRRPPSGHRVAHR